MNEQQINQLTDLIYGENPVGVRDFILATLPDAATRQGFILGARGVELFREAVTEDKISSAQVMHDLLPDLNSQHQLLESSGTVGGHDNLENERSVFALIVTYGSPELVQQEVSNAGIGSLDLILNDIGVEGFQIAVNFDKQTVVEIILQSLESRDDRVMLIKTAFAGMSDNLSTDRDVVNMAEAMLDALDLNHIQELILSVEGIGAFERMVVNSHIEAVKLMLNSLESDEQRQDLVNGIVRNPNYESEEMQRILDAFWQEELALEGLVGDGYESSEGGTSNSETSTEEDSDHSEDELGSDDEADLVIADPVNAQPLNAQPLNVQGDILDGFGVAFPPATFAASDHQSEESESEGEEVNNKRAPSPSLYPTSSKKSKPNDYDREGGQGI